MHIVSFSPDDNPEVDSVRPVLHVERLRHRGLSPKVTSPVAAQLESECESVQRTNSSHAAPWHTASLQSCHAAPWHTPSLQSCHAVDTPAPSLRGPPESRPWSSAHTEERGPLGIFLEISKYAHDRTTRIQTSFRSMSKSDIRENGLKKKKDVFFTPFLKCSHLIHLEIPTLPRRTLR